MVGGEMSYCYICGQELKNENDEHVIPSALGGRLKTKNIICSFHNNMLSDLDNYLCQDLTFLTNFVNPHRDNNENTIPKVKMEYENVDLYRESNGDAKGLYFRADEDNGVLTLDVKLCYSANSEAEKDNLRELKKRLKGVAKQFQKDNAWVEMAYERILAESSVYSAAEPLFSSFTINKSKKLFLSFLKIAIGYFLYSDGNYADIQNAITILKNRDIEQVHKIANYYYKRDFYPINCICHTLILIGDSHLNKLYVLISLYSTMNVIVILNNHYEGNDFSKAYSYDLYQKCELPCRIWKIETLEEIDEILRYDHLKKGFPNEFIEKYEYFMYLVYKNRKIDELFKLLMKRVF